MRGKRVVVLGLIFLAIGVLVMAMGEGVVSRAGLAVAVCGGGYLLLGLLQLITGR